jgi:N-acetyl sugar amidotransferase
MIYCSKCLMPSSRPRVVFTDGVCNACRWIPEYKQTDWDQRKSDFLELVKSKKRHPVYDCIIPFSGGKDSASIAHRLKYDLGLRPLLVCFGQLLWTDVGRRNLHRVADAGFDIFYWRVDQSVSRRLARRFFIERGHPKQHYDSSVNAVPLITSINFGIPLVIYAEHGESFYGGHVLSEEHRRRRDLAEVLENQVGDDARNWAVDGITEADLYPYIMPDKVDDIEAVYYSYYFPWSIYDNAKYCREKMGFEVARSRQPAGVVLDLALEAFDPCGPLFGQYLCGKSDGSFEGFDSIDDMIDDLDYYMMHVKFGFGRATRMASRLIQDGRLSRKAGLDMVKMFDGEWPRTYLEPVLDYLDLSVVNLHDIIDQHRNPEIWEPWDTVEQGGVVRTWKLKHPPQ